MTLTLLIDLDDTLLGNDMDTFIPAYLGALGKHIAHHAPPDQMAATMLAATQRMFENTRPDRTLKESFDPAFYPPLGLTEAQVRAEIEAFYTHIFPTLKSVTQTQPQTIPFIQAAIGRGYQIGIATNPLFPRAAIIERLRWAGLPPEKYPFALIPSYESFHFAKPNPAYFAEFLGRINWPRGPILMIGNDPDHDVRGASELGIPVFWIDRGSAKIPNGFPTPNSSGALADVLPWIDSLTPRELMPDYTSTTAIIATLRGVPAALSGISANLLASNLPLIETICHLRDVEREINLPQLQKITKIDNPRLPEINTAAWAEERNGPAALSEFIAARIETLELLDNLSTADWSLPARHASLGATNLQEIANLMAKHDREWVRRGRVSGN
ncbi:MAG: HAD family hydrolase [Chloroflexota bacterium]|nr:HAD family hydrolase [Chloroflexota bacterium]